jgi:hypothetical protein
VNSAVIKRQILRQIYARPRAPYEDFLRKMQSRGDVWMVPQREVASWWEARQSSEIRVERGAGGALKLSCELPRAVIEVAGAELRIPPVEIAVRSEPTGPAHEAPCITFECSHALELFSLEVFAHFGYGHLKLAGAGQRPDIPKTALDPILTRLRESAMLHWNYGSGDAAAFRDLVREAHRTRGLPELRLWPLPHYRGRPYRVCVSSRYDVDRAIVNIPVVHDLEAACGMRSTAYLRPMGPFYGAREIRSYLKQAGDSEIALHGEFVTTARRLGDEFKAAVGEKKRLEELIGQEVSGVCMHGGELRDNTTANTKAAIEAAGFKYETIYQNQYYLPLHLPSGEGVYRCLSIGRNFMDLRLEPGPNFQKEMSAKLLERLAEAEAVGGVFVPILHPLYFGLGRYLGRPENIYRIATHLPGFLLNSARMRREASYSDRP